MQILNITLVYKGVYLNVSLMLRHNKISIFVKHFINFLLRHSGLLESFPAG